ncbi:uncharacterized protein Ecym_2465 [Eremothecium cymbalariae DBVPG|uniref:AB hydrolase-1 domain-containing protein n=1 Tax=Eremothecium cymbalariae (strain CBS 270.75 / DBVPG 7215 / KCTC 17166 / NRRL Y-17582) TaxID=931890 RepID=G8JPT3_ERECY|nr:Hypothetical protein Ecym_2465 [Eremothecium cymbalariae DBVPG\
MFIKNNKASPVPNILRCLINSSQFSIERNKYGANMSSFTSPKPTPPTAIPLMEILLNIPSLFPMPLKESWKDYKIFHDDVDKFQTGLLSTLPFFPSAADGKIGEIIRTPVDEEGNYINEFCIRPNSPPVNPKDSKMHHLIFVHGYGAGLGFFLKNFENIKLLNNSWTIHAIDFPGYGFSSRPKFPFSINKNTASEVENWFHDRFEIWLQKRGLLEDQERNLVLAHSLGAYLIALYAQSRPKHLKKLIMCSPAGICPSNKVIKQPPWWFVKLWDRNLSPFSLVRNSGIFGSKLTSGWSFRRFKQFLNEGTMGESQFQALHRYAYAIFNKPGSGEYLLSFVLKCGGDPRSPLLSRLFNSQAADSFKAQCDWLWMYGDQDWMDCKGGEQASDFIVRHIGKESNVHVIPQSGHHLYLDNYSVFNELLQAEMAKMSGLHTTQP